MTIYTDLRDSTIPPLLTTYGTTATFRQLAASYNPATGISTNTPTDTSIKIVVTKAGGRTKFRDENVARAAYVFIAAADALNTAGITPNVNDKIEYSSKVYSILEIEEVKPGGVAVIYKFLVED